MKPISLPAVLVVTLALILPGCTTTTVTVDGHNASVVVEAPGFYSYDQAITRAHNATSKACAGYTKDRKKLEGLFAPLLFRGELDEAQEIADAILKLGNDVHAAVKGWFGTTTVTLTAKCLSP